MIIPLETSSLSTDVHQMSESVGKDVERGGEREMLNVRERKTVQKAGQM